MTLQTKSISSPVQNVTLRKYFSHPSLVLYSFATPPIKLKLGQQIGGGLLVNACFMLFIHFSIINAPPSSLFDPKWVQVIGFVEMVRNLMPLSTSNTKRGRRAC